MEAARIERVSNMGNLLQAIACAIGMLVVGVPAIAGANEGRPGIVVIMVDDIGAKGLLPCASVSLRCYDALSEPES